MAQFSFSAQYKLKKINPFYFFHSKHSFLFTYAKQFALQQKNT